MVDQVKVVAEEQAPAEQSLRRNLTNRHIQLIAIGGAIGTGLFMGSGKTISLAGPSIIFVYMIIGFMLFFVMRAMGGNCCFRIWNTNLLVTSLPILLGPWAGYFYWLDLLVLLGSNRDGRCRCHYRICAILVPLGFLTGLLRYP